MTTNLLSALIIPKTHKKVSDHVNVNMLDLNNLETNYTRNELDLLANNVLGPDSSLTLGTDQNYLLRDLLAVVGYSVVFRTPSSSNPLDYYGCTTRRATIQIHDKATRILKFPGQKLTVVNKTGKGGYFHLFNYDSNTDKPKAHKKIYLHSDEEITFD